MATDTSTNQRARVAVTVSKDFMTASVLLRVPQETDAPISVEEVMQELERAEVVFGIDENAISRAVSNCEYNAPIRVAVGRKPYTEG